MTGAFRFLLAILVMLAHLAEGAKATAHLGIFSVFGFYILSGYLITRVLNERYAGRGGAFWVNRFWRLAPIYAAIVTLTLVCQTIFFADMAAFKPDAWAKHPDMFEIFSTVAVVPMSAGPWVSSPYRLVPPIWSVGVEIVNYFLLWAIIARHWKAAASTLVIAVLFHIASYAAGQSWGYRYSPFWAATLPFAIGSLIHFQIAKLYAGSVVKDTRLWLGSATSLWMINLLSAGFTSGLSDTAVFNLHFYVNMTLIAVMIYFAETGDARLPKSVDKALGDLAYPIFLIHWLIGFLVAHFLFPGQARGVAIFLAAVPLVIVASLGLATAQERLFEPLRQRLRSPAVVDRAAAQQGYGKS